MSRLIPWEDRDPIYTKPNIAAATKVVTQYLTLHGPSTRAHTAGFIGTAATALSDSWPADLTEVKLDGKKAFLPSTQIPQLENPPEPDLVRLLPPWDSFLQARDRSVLVPNKAEQKEIWRILGNPGVILAEGEIVGTWRAQAKGNKRLTFSLNPLWTVTAKNRKAAEEEGRKIAEVRGFPDLTIDWLG